MNLLTEYAAEYAHRILSYGLGWLGWLIDHNMKHEWYDLSQALPVPRGRQCFKCKKKQFHVNVRKPNGKPRFVWRPRLGLCTGAKPNGKEKT